MFELALIPAFSHLTHLQLENPPLPLHVLPSVGSVSPHHPQLPRLLPSFLLQLPSKKGKKKAEFEATKIEDHS